MDTAGPITDPNGLLYGIAAVIGLFAAFYWFRVGKGDLDKPPAWSDLRFASLLTAGALLFGSLGRLV